MPPPNHPAVAVPEPQPSGSIRCGDMRFAEFIALMAWLMALPALSIDIMLVALPDISTAFALAEDNDRQWMITAYMIGFALGQLLYGPVSDRYGRKPMLYLGLGLYIVASLAVLAAADYQWLLMARGLQGLAIAAPRILAIAIVRDCSVGRGMSRIMSFIMMIFIVVPIFAPALGALLVLWSGWPLIFWFMALAAVVAVVWIAWRLPETLDPADRASLRPAALLQSLGAVLKTRQTVGYGIAIGFVFGCILTYVGSSQQVFVDVYDLGDGFVIAFGAVAMVMAVSSITNLRLVQRLGMRRISHTGIVGFLAVSVLYLVAGFPAIPPLWLFYLYLVGSFYLLCLCMPNFNAMAMEPVGHMAGMGSALLGFYTTIAGAFFGWLFGQAFDGTVRPLVLGFLLLGLATLVSVLVTERGRLWAHHDP